MVGSAGDLYIALSMAAMEVGGIPAGFDVITGALYEKDGPALRRYLSGRAIRPRRPRPAGGAHPAPLNRSAPCSG